MKRKICSIIMGLALMISLAGCGNNDSAETSNNEQLSAYSTTVSGSFTVGVRDVIPDYCLDDVTPCVAVVTEFQSYPFTMYVGEEIGSQLQPGEVYVFTIEPITVDYAKETLEQMNLSSLVWELSGFEIVDVRMAEEHEIGLESLQLSFSENEE